MKLGAAVQSSATLHYLPAAASSRTGAGRFARPYRNGHTSTCRCRVHLVEDIARQLADPVFALQAATLVSQPLVIVLIAVPLRYALKTGGSDMKSQRWTDSGDGRNCDGALLMSKVSRQHGIW